MSGENSARLGELLARDELSVIEHGGAAAVVHHAGAAPTRASSPTAPWPSDSAYSKLVARLRELEGPFAWNAWLHAREPKHMHFVPRLTALAGIELGAGLYVNVPPPEAAAERLRR